MSRLANIIKAKFSYPALPPPDTFAGQTVLITGGTSGLGFATAVHFVRLGASRVIITGRTLSRAQAAATQIETQTGAHGVVEARALDMDTFSGVQEFANALMRDVHTIDTVLLNAGLLIYEFETSPEGWEKALQVSALSTPLLALMLVPWMRRAKSTNGQTKHLSVVSSSMAMLVDLTDSKFPRHDVLRYWSEEKHFSSFDQSYNRSRLFLEYAVAEIADMVRDKNGKYAIPSSLSPPSLQIILSSNA
jgi:NAD(P)-dependent dehydrogenase (short-subunit alcohol dehydrogenase family)